MLKYILVLALVTCTLLVSVNAWIDMRDRLKDRVIHMESLLTRGRWLWQNDNKDSDGSRYLWVDPLAERDTYYTPPVQFQTTLCGGGQYLCLEPLNLLNYFLAAGYPGDGDKYTVKLQYTTYPEGDNRFHWKILCQNDTLERCKFVPVRFEADTCYLMSTDNWGSESGHDGHYDATLGIEEGFITYFRVHAPNPSDGQNQIYENTNEGTIDQTVKYSATVGVTQTSQTTATISKTVSTEIGAAFKAFSVSHSSSISKTWSTTESTTYEAAKTVEHDLNLKNRTRTVLLQLMGNYADEFKVGADSYTIQEYPLDGGEARTYTICPKSASKYKATLQSQGSVNWPAGTYGLPMPTDGCPASWEKGTRYQDCEDKNPSNHWSTPCHLKGPYDKGNMQRNFCVKTDSSGTGNWPAGEYCIYRKGGNCPQGMTVGSIKWDDEDKDNGNTVGGTLPDGQYDANTVSEFCCQTKGKATTAISLPTEKPFILYQYNGCQCQEVDGMSYMPEYFFWDTEDDDNHDNQSGTHPVDGVFNSDNVKLRHCYYTKIQ